MLTRLHLPSWRPATRLGRWAVSLMIAFLAMFLINGLFMQFNTGSWWQQNLLPFYGILMLLCGLSAGVTGMLAVTKKHERSWLVWLTVLPMIFVLFLVSGEFVAALFGFVH